jgi:hypothetical protein
MGMSSSTRQQTLGAARSRPVTAKPERDVIFTANGSTDAVYHVRRVGALIGMESTNRRPPEKYDIDFLDWPFDKLNEYDDHDDLFERHKRTVRGERPTYAVAPDLDGTFPEETVYDMADELAAYADTIIVTPKEVIPERVPVRFRIGMPCQPRYGPPPWPTRAYRHVNEVHLLGGSPTTHREKMKYVPVQSVDTAVPVKSAYFGSYWNGKKWCQAPEGFGYYRCLKRSYSGLRRMLNRNRRMWDPHARNRWEDYKDWFWSEHPDRDLWGADENPPRPGREFWIDDDCPI